MATKSISQLDTAESLALGDLFEIAIPDGNSATGYSSRKTSLTNIADFTQSTAANNSLETTAKTIVGAINEVDAKSVKWEQENLLGCKNLVPYDTEDKSGKVSSGATFEVLEDGKIKVNRTTTSGTALFYLSGRTKDGKLFLPNGRYFLSGCPEGGSTSSTTGYQMSISSTISGSNYAYGYDGGDGFEFEVNGDDFSNDGAWCRISIILRSGVSATNMIFEPLLTLASIKDRSYVPPQNTNEYLTRKKVGSSNLATDETTDNASRAYTVGEYMLLRGILYKVTATISANGAITPGTNVTQTTIGAELKALFDALSQ